jgi:pyruvate-ferredoxin/flavodoxin oxidoreductase
LVSINTLEAKFLLELADHLVSHSVWIVGGDGWAYDIDYGGLDHVLASGQKVNILVLDTQVYSNTGGQRSKATPRGAVAKFAYSGKQEAKKDLGIMTMNYGNVYVAQIALGANPTQAIRALKEAEAYPGAALVLAYSHCIAHGYDLKHGLEQQKLAVQSGFWPLYRYNPLLVRENKNPFQLDCQPPSVKIENFVANEPRFRSLAARDVEHYQKLITELQNDVERKWKIYAELAKEK